MKGLEGGFTIENWRHYHQNLAKVYLAED